MLHRAGDIGALTEAINPAATPIPQFLLDKHFLRKHGPAAYYGQIPRE